MSPQRDYYRILHVQPDAPVEVIRASYRTLMQALRGHPDLGGDHRTAVLLNEAYAVLRDKARRAAYDAARRQAAPAPPRSRRADGTVATDECRFCGAGRDGRKAPEPGDSCHRCASPLRPVDRSRLEAGQRAIRRIRRRYPITFRTTWPQAFAIAGRMQDISLHGLKFITAERLSAGQVIRIESGICRAVARVIGTQPGPSSRRRQWLVRAEFLTLEFDRTVGSFVSETA